MSSPTIRYSGVPENSHSRDRDHSTRAADFDSDTAAYATFRSAASTDSTSANARPRTSESASQSQSAAADDSGARPNPPGSSGGSGRESDLTLKWRRRLRDSPEPASNPTAHGEFGRTDVTGGAESDRRSGFVPGFRFEPGPVESDPRHNPAYPHPKNPGLFAEVDGYYDWADRRLFLSDGSPDPMTPGAYRYQTRPDLCVLDAADDDPWSPRYEPDHLRHKPGDDWIIDGNRPYDALDPGPFGSPWWFPDLRTGRHRRDELPDPIPWWEIEEDPAKAEWAEHAEALYDRRARSTPRNRRTGGTERPRDGDHDRDDVGNHHGRNGNNGTTDSTGRPAGGSSRAALQRSSRAESAGAGRGGDTGVAGGSGDRRGPRVGGPDPRPSTGDGPDARRAGRTEPALREAQPHEDDAGPPVTPDRRSQRASDRPSARTSGSPSDRSSGRSSGQSSDRPADHPADRLSDRPSPSTPRRSREQAGAEPGEYSHGSPGEPDRPLTLEAPYRFSKMREDAWERFLDKSVDLAAAHHPVTAAREHGPTIALWVRLVRWMIAVVRGSVRVPVGGTHTSEPHTFGPNLLQSRTVPPRTSPPRTSLPRAASALGAPLAPFASPAPSSNSLGQGLRVAVAEKVAPKRHTDLAARTSSLAKAIRGAQRARAEGAGAGASEPQDERHRREQPRGSEQKTEQDPTFVLDWERHFDSIQALRGLAEQVRSARSVRSAEGLARGAAWA